MPADYYFRPRRWRFRDAADGIGDMNTPHSLAVDHFAEAMPPRYLQVLPLAAKVAAVLPRRRPWL